MDEDHLQTFQQLTRQASFGGTARALGISQPAVTYRIDRLEEQLGVKLIEEPRRGVTLTREGREVLSFADLVLPEFDALRRSLSGDVQPREPLKVVAPGSIGRTLLFPILCGRDFEDVPLVLLFRSADEIFELVRRGDCDVGLNYRTHVSHVLEVEEVCHEEFVLITPPGQPVPDALDAEVLADLPFITYEEFDYVFGCWFESALGDRPAQVISTHHFTRLDEVIRTVALGRGVSIVPLPACREAAAADDVRVVRTLHRCRNANYLITRSGWSPTPAFESLRAALRAVDA